MVNLGFEGLPPGCSMGCPWEPMGVANETFGAPPLDANENLGISAGCAASGPTGLAFGEGGMARPSFIPGPPRPFPPGCGGRRRGTGDDIV